MRDSLGRENEGGRVDAISLVCNVTSVWRGRVEHEAAVMFVAKLRKGEE